MMATEQINYAAGWELAALTPRGAAVLAILRAQDLVRELDAADREYLAPYAAELLVDLCADAPLARAAAPTTAVLRERRGLGASPAFARTPRHSVLAASVRPRRLPWTVPHARHGTPMPKALVCTD